MSDFAFGEFVKILKYVALKKDRVVPMIDQWFPSSKMCDHCAHANNDLSLRDRVWDCSDCHNTLGRDSNAAINIYRVGASTLSGDSVRAATAGSNYG